MEQELIISHEAPSISANFDAVAKALDTELERYTSLVVTPDNIQDAKKAAAELNKYAGTIDTKRKETVSEVSAPIKAFESQMKICASGARPPARASSIRSRDMMTRSRRKPANCSKTRAPAYGPL